MIGRGRCPAKTGAFKIVLVLVLGLLAVKKSATSTTTTTIRRRAPWKRV